jgi:hypothetical protein
MILAKKIKAGALQFVLFIGAVVAVLLLSFVLVSYSHNVFHKKTDVAIEVIQAANAGLDYSFSKNMLDGDLLEVPYEDDLNITVEVKKSYWGILEKRTAKAKKGQFTFEKIALVGNSNPDKPVLYLKDNQRPLVVAGNVKITGIVYLPEQGVKMGNIYGNSYYDSRLIFGNQKESRSTLPEFDKEVLNQITALTYKQEPKGDEITLKKELVVKNSFKNSIKVIKGSFVQLDKVKLSGNIIVWATQKITVTAASKLNDVILIAPQIEIANWSKGNFQALASESITIGKGCELNYPTALVLNQQGIDGLTTDNMNPGIFIDQYAQIRGMVIYHDKGEPNRFKPHIKINEHAKIYGEVYSTQNLELKGSIYGNATTNSFVALENGNIYQNHLYNGKINSSMLPDEYGGIIYASTNSNQVMKWLY